METAEYSHLKAVIKLLRNDLGKYTPMLKKELVGAIQKNPTLVQEVVSCELKTQPSNSILNTVEEAFWEDLIIELQNYKKMSSHSLKEGLILLSKFTDLSCTKQHVDFLLNKYTKNLQYLLLTASSKREFVASIQKNISFIYTIPTTDKIYNLKYFSFARLLRKKEGSNLIIACLYKIIGEEYNFPIQIVNMAGKLMIHIPIGHPNEDFFIHPQESNKILTLLDCRAKIAMSGLSWRETYLRPLSSLQILHYLIAQMVFVANRKNDVHSLNYLQKYIKII